MIVDPRDWQPIATAPSDRLVWTKIDDARYGERNVVKLTKRGRLWYASSTMYVYYDPTHWRPL